MADQALLFGAAGRTDDGEVLSDFEVDYTPPAVAVQMLLALLEEVGDRLAGDCRDCDGEGEDCQTCGGTGRAVGHGANILDPSAGSGVWARAARAVIGESAFIVGCEPRESERANVVAAHDLGVICDFERALALDGPLGGIVFRLILSNPPFSAFEAGWWLDLLRSDRLHSGSVIMFLGLSQWGQTKEASALLREWAPSLQLRAGGRIAFRPHGEITMRPIPKNRRVPGGPTHEPRKNGSDSREYSGWVWLVGENEGTARPSWRVRQLPVLPTELLRWLPSAVPGTYPIDKALVERVRSDYL